MKTSQVKYVTENILTLEKQCCYMAFFPLIPFTPLPFLTWYFLSTIYIDKFRKYRKFQGKKASDTLAFRGSRQHLYAQFANYWDGSCQRLLRYTNVSATIQYTVVWLRGSKYFQIKLTNLFLVRKLGVFKTKIYELYIKKLPFNEE